jgi:hypothetical protein
MLRKPQKPPEGAKMKETADMVAWRKEFEKMKTEDHKSKLKELGLDDEDLEEFEALEKGEVSLEQEMGADEAAKQAEATPKKKAKK